MFRQRLLNNIIASFLIANLLILIGKGDWLGSFLQPLHYLDMLMTFISVFIVFEYIDRISTYLNGKVSWLSHLLKRALMQIMLGVAVPALMATLLTYIMWEFVWHKGLIEDDYFTYDFVFQVLLMVAINLYFVILFLFRNMAGKSKSSASTILGNKGSSKIPVPLENTAYILLRNGIVYLTTFSNEQIILPQNMEYYEKILPKEYFFRANRQFIVHRHSCKSFNSAMNGKVEILVAPVSTTVVVSQKRAAGFRSWIQN
ncbi:MAG: LytTR family transcriptional regulator [Cytophagales bacterium]|nr:LytTR family transcriptional regulator [Cytophagales bacterium]